MAEACTPCPARADDERNVHRAPDPGCLWRVAALPQDRTHQLASSLAAKTQEATAVAGTAQRERKEKVGGRRDRRRPWPLACLTRQQQPSSSLPVADPPPPNTHTVGPTDLLPPPPPPHTQDMLLLEVGELKRELDAVEEELARSREEAAHALARVGHGRVCLGWGSGGGGGVRILGRSSA